MFYLPQYLPELALVELIFVAIKRKMKKKANRDGWNFNTNEGKKAITRAWSEISEESITKAWIETVKRSKYYILEGARTSGAPQK